MSSPPKTTADVKAPTMTLPEEFNPDVKVEAETPLQPGEDSDLGSSLATNGTQSISSSVRDYVYSNGRRYHRYGGEGKYVSPNDETEQDRLDMQHHQTLQLLGGNLYTAPLETEKVHRVLDCGTGTGIWALDFGETHPAAQVIGVDLSPIQPSWVYSNVKFEVDDLEKDWTWPEEYFDFIHARELKNGIRDYAKFAGQMYRHLAPGGWAEFSEMSVETVCQDDTYTPDTYTYKWLHAYEDCAKKAGLSVMKAEEMKKVLEDAGFVDVRIKTFLNPLGPWPKNKKLREMGAFMCCILESGFDAYGLALLTTLGGYTVEDARKLAADTVRELVSRKVHVSNLLHQVIGRKPTAEES